MEREKLESMLIDYIDNKLNSVDRHHVEQELMKNPASYKLYEELKEVIQTMGKVNQAEPTGSLKLKFQSMLKEEMGQSREARVIAMRPWWYAVAAGVALLLTGIAAGLLINQKRARDAERLALQKDREHAALVVAMISDEQSAGQRILGVKEVYSYESLSSDIFKVLIKTMDEDPNSNVRLAAIDALRKFSNEPVVRKALVASMSKQTDPVIQIALIQLMVELHEKEALKPMKQIIENETLLQAVKDEAHVGIQALS